MLKQSTVKAQQERANVLFGRHRNLMDTKDNGNIDRLEWTVFGKGGLIVSFLNSMTQS